MRSRWKSSRRGFLSEAAAGAIVLSAGTAFGADVVSLSCVCPRSESAVGGSFNLAFATAATFAECRSEPFQFSGPSSREMLLEVTRVQELKSSGDQNRPLDLREPFSVIFGGQDCAELTQGTYRLAHPRLGTFELFLVPVESSGQERFLEAVFG